MNIKLHTPKSLKAGSGMATTKQFMLSLLATTVSIALTFGTAAIVDHSKKEKEKRGIVMMVMYDMYKSLKSIEQADSMLLRSLDLQLQLAQDTTRFSELRFEMARMIPVTDYTETTERIVSSSIETINTVGNVLFTENVAVFYQTRRQYKTVVCDSLVRELSVSQPLATIKGALDLEFCNYALVSSYLLEDMKWLFAQSKWMMGVRDGEIEAYQRSRERMGYSLSEDHGGGDNKTDEVLEQQKKIEDARKKLGL